MCDFHIKNFFCINLLIIFEKWWVFYNNVECKRRTSKNHTKRKFSSNDIDAMCMVGLGKESSIMFGTIIFPQIA